jgi:hypothetical protein
LVEVNPGDGGASRHLIGRRTAQIRDQEDRGDEDESQQSAARHFTLPEEVVFDPFGAIRRASQNLSAY